MSISLKSAVRKVVSAVAVINGRFPIKWEDIIDKPAIPDIDISDYYTKQEVIELFKNSRQLTDPDGNIWEPSIDNNGQLTWKKVGSNGSKTTG